MLIELVIVIVVLGILATTAIPRFTSLPIGARAAEVERMAGALGSASAINFAVRGLGTGNGVAVADCRDVENALEGMLDDVYEIVATAITAGSTANCTVRRIDDEAVAGTFEGHGID